MVLYAPGTEETDPKKQNMSLQAIAASATTTAASTATNTTNIATNTAAIAALNAATYVNSIAGNNGAFTLGAGLSNNTNSLVVSLSKLTASLGADVLLNNTANYFDGPSVAQGSTGTWFASGNVTVRDNAGVATISAKLWDGTTIVNSGSVSIPASGELMVIALSGIFTSPAGNIRISCNDGTSTSGFIKFNQSGNSKDSTITVIRIA